MKVTTLKEKKMNSGKKIIFDKEEKKIKPVSDFSTAVTAKRQLSNSCTVLKKSNIMLKVTHTIRQTSIKAIDRYSRKTKSFQEENILEFLLKNKNKTTQQLYPRNEELKSE